MLYYVALALISARNIYGIAIMWLDPSDEGCGGPSTQINSSHRGVSSYVRLEMKKGVNSAY